MAVPPRRVRSRLRALAAVAIVIAIAGVLAGCRVDATVDVEMAEDGSGTLTLTLVADADVVKQAGGLADDLHVDDLIAIGWEVEPPADTDGGGLRMVLRHDFAAPEELTALLASLNGTDGPFKSVSFTRTNGGSEIRYAINGTGRVDAGLASFADADLITAVGATPYADDVASAGLSQSDALVITFRVALPGTVERTTGTDADGRLSWVIPLDSRPVDLATATSLSLRRGGVWKAASATLQVLFVAWVVLSVVVLGYVLFARQRRARRPPPAYLPRVARRGSPGLGRARPELGAQGRDDRRGNEGWDDKGWDDEGWDEGWDGEPAEEPPDDGGPRRPTFPRPNT